MNKTNFAMFMAGLTVGAATAWLCLRKRYEQIAQEEIDSVKATYAERKVSTNNNSSDKTPMNHKEISNDESNKIKADRAKLKPDLVDYAAKLAEKGYTNYSMPNEKNVKEEETVTMTDKPYVISPDDFGDMDDYAQISLTYYSDDILADEDDEIIEDVEETVGIDFAEHFGDYEDDSVFVRNDRLKCDYEILRDNRPYSDVTGQVED